jgi:hypothetical protein
MGALDEGDIETDLRHLAESLEEQPGK